MHVPCVHQTRHQTRTNIFPPSLFAEGIRSLRRCLHWQGLGMIQVTCLHEGCGCMGPSGGWQARFRFPVSTLRLEICPAARQNQPIPYMHALTHFKTPLDLLVFSREDIHWIVNIFVVSA